MKVYFSSITHHDKPIVFEHDSNEDTLSLSNPVLLTDGETVQLSEEDFRQIRTKFIKAIQPSETDSNHIETQFNAKDITLNGSQLILQSYRDFLQSQEVLEHKRYVIDPIDNSRLTDSPQVIRKTRANAPEQFASKSHHLSNFYKHKRKPKRSIPKSKERHTAQVINLERVFPLHSEVWRDTIIWLPEPDGNGVEMRQLRMETLDKTPVITRDQLMNVASAKPDLELAQIKQKQMMALLQLLEQAIFPAYRQYASATTIIEKEHKAICRALGQICFDIMINPLYAHPLDIDTYSNFMKKTVGEGFVEQQRQLQLQMRSQIILSALNNPDFSLINETAHLAAIMQIAHEHPDFKQLVGHVNVIITQRGQMRRDNDRFKQELKEIIEIDTGKFISIASICQRLKLGTLSNALSRLLAECSRELWQLSQSGSDTDQAYKPYVHSISVKDENNLYVRCDIAENILSAVREAIFPSAPSKHAAKVDVSKKLEIFQKSLSDVRKQEKFLAPLKITIKQIIENSLQSLSTKEEVTTTLKS